MAPECTIMTLFVPFAPSYNNFTNLIFVPIIIIIIFIEDINFTDK